MNNLLIFFGNKRMKFHGNTHFTCTCFILTFIVLMLSAVAPPDTRANNSDDKGGKETDDSSNLLTVRTDSIDVTSLIRSQGSTHDVTITVHPSVFPDGMSLNFPLNKEHWADDGRQILSESDVWGRRIDVRQIFRVGDMWGLFYGSRPGPDDESEAVLTASLAFSHDLIHWKDSPANPIMHELAQDWQGIRARAEALHYDEENGRWIMFIGGNGANHIPGLRAVGIAYSDDLKSWTFSDNNPIVTVDTGNIRDWGAGEEVVRVYPIGVRRHNGKWYLFIQAGGPSPGEFKAVYHAGVLVADQPEGPWRDTGHNPIIRRGHEGEWDESGVFAAGGIHFHNGRWILTYANRTGQVGFAISESEDPAYGWSKADDNPLIEGDEVRRSFILVPYGDTWKLLYSVLTDGLDSGDPRRLYMLKYGAPERD